MVMKNVLGDSKLLAHGGDESTSKLLGSTVVSPYVGMARKQMAATMEVLAFKRQYFTWW